MRNVLRAHEYTVDVWKAGTHGPFILGGLDLAFLAESQGGDELVADVGGGDAGDLGVVVGRGDLDDVRADQVAVGEGAEHREELAAGQAAGLRGACAGGERRVEDVDRPPGCTGAAAGRTRGCGPGRSATWPHPMLESGS